MSNIKIEVFWTANAKEDFKILYQIKENSIFIIRVFNSLQNPIKSLK